MEREIVTFPIRPEHIYDELAHFVQVFAARGCRTCAVVFGYPWGNEYYGDSTVWNEVTLPLTGLVQKIRDVEATGTGRLGHADLFVRIESIDELKFQFCHEADIHIEFSEPSDVTESFYQRWKELGYTPREFAEQELVRTN